MSARAFRSGADGLVMICASDHADAKMRMFNADGSEGRMCGNAIRCVGKYLYEHRLVPKEQMVIETLSGDKRLTLKTDGRAGERSGRRHGPGLLCTPGYPGMQRKPAHRRPLSMQGADYRVTALSVGNPHQVIFTEGIDDLPLDKLARA